MRQKMLFFDSDPLLSFFTAVSSESVKKVQLGNLLH